MSIPLPSSIPPLGFYTKELRMSASAEQPVPQTHQPSVEPFLRFYHAESLRVKTLAVLTTLEQAQDSTRHRGALSDIVLELTDSGLAYYFLRPLKLAQVGFVVEQSAHLGMGGVMRVIAPIVRSIIGRMDAQQLLTVCSHMRQLME
jgi:hypothetical protein